MKPHSTYARTTLFFVIAVCCILLAACRENKAEAPTPSATPSAQAEAPTPSATPSAQADAAKTQQAPGVVPGTADPKVEREVVDAYNEFGCRLYTELLKDGSGNTFISPVSIAMALAMTYNGAEGETKQAMAATLCVPKLPLDEFNDANAAIIKTLVDADADVTLNLANSLWACEAIPFKKPFLRRTRAFYSAEVENVNFLAPGTLARINAWVEKKTENKITKLVKQQDLNKDTLLILINAIYFKGKWETPFEKSATRDREFTLVDGSKKKCPMMSRSDEFPYFIGTGFQAISLPYTGDRLRMAVFLPDENSTLKEFLKSVTATNWKAWLSRFRDRDGSIVLPRFKMEFEAELNDPLSRMGMAVAFNRRRADFRNMCVLKPGDNAYISKVRHKSFVEVNEEGTEAAAATAVVMMKLTATMPQKPFRMVVDRPFFFVIYDSETRAILFMGSVTDPR